jgi:flagellar biosynthesis/type III secretory pathway chaperone
LLSLVAVVGKIDLNKTKKMTTMKIFATAILSLFATLAIAQQQKMPMPQQQQEVSTDYSNDEIETFVEANLDVTKVQQNAQKKAMTIIEKNNLEIDRFNEIVAIQQGQSDEEASPEEMQAFNAAAQKIMANNKETQSKMVAVLKNYDISQEKYQKIMMAYQQDEEFRMKVDTVVQSKSNG